MTRDSAFIFLAQFILASASTNIDGQCDPDRIATGYVGRRKAFESVEQDPALVYSCDIERLKDEWRRCANDGPLKDVDIGRSFTALTLDNETKNFLRKCIEQQPGFVGNSIRTLLRTFLSVTDTNALLGTGEMFVLSKEQVMNLLNITNHEPRGRLLDVGAGDGAVTEKMAPFFEEVVTTEVSSHMARRLKSKGYISHCSSDIDSVIAEDEYFDVISFLNVLDRCTRPRKLLEQMRKRLKKGTGRLLMSVVLPFKPFVEMGSKQGRPEHPIKVAGQEFEESLACLIHCTLIPAGFEVERIARVPYISAGDINHVYYVLDDAILVLRSRE